MMFSKGAVVSWALFTGAMPLSLAFSPISLRLQNFVEHRSASRPGVVLFGDKKSLSASAKERREEEKRRLERKADVVIGKTSARPEAQDYQINSKATEQEWMRQASNVEQKVYRETEKGMEMLKMVRVHLCP
jgi:hypothetical protein